MQASKQLVETDELPGVGRNALRKFIAMIDRWTSEAANFSPRDLAELILEESGYTDYWRHSKISESRFKAR